MMMSAKHTSTTFFKSISSQYSGKVKTFENSEHTNDELFHEIFNVCQSGASIGRKYNIHPGVFVFLQTSSETFDVVKKRRTIEAANESVGADVTSVLLGSEAAAEYFHQFSSEVSSMIVCVFSNLNILMCRSWMLLRP